MASSDVMTSVVRLRGVSKTFGEGGASVRALRGVDLEIPGGNLFMVVGPSGCGKTTLVSVIAGTLDADEGEVEVLGERLDGMSRGEKTRFRRRNVGFIFQQYNLLPGLTAAENAAVPLMLNGVGKAAALKGARAMLDRMGIGDKADVLPRFLSGGQQQRIAIARSLVHEPRLLVCDEPTAALDGETGRTVMEIVRDQAVKPGRAVIMVTHDSRMFGYGDRFAMMLDGTVSRVVTDVREVHA